MITLSVDIGGSNIKMMLFDDKNEYLGTRKIANTPQPATPANILLVLQGLLSEFPKYQCLCLGFPGVVKFGVVYTAPNLDSSWVDYDLLTALKQLTSVPTLIANDADLQGYGVIVGIGVEMVITLGTGIGSALFIDGTLVPNLELGHHPWRKGRSYEDLLGNAALKKKGEAKWFKNLLRAIAQMQHTFNYDIIYLGGGNSRYLKGKKLPENVRVCDNVAGLIGGVRLWQLQNR